MVVQMRRVAATTAGPAILPYPETGTYWAKPDETCQKVGRLLGVESGGLGSVSRRNVATG